jgi:hypothetical protein
LILLTLNIVNFNDIKAKCQVNTVMQIVSAASHALADGITTAGGFEAPAFKKSLEKVWC